MHENDNSFVRTPQFPIEPGELFFRNTSACVVCVRSDIFVPTRKIAVENDDLIISDFECPIEIINAQGLLPLAFGDGSEVMVANDPICRSCRAIEYIFDKLQFRRANVRTPVGSLDNIAICD